MSKKVSRTQLAEHVASRLLSGDETVVRELAAYLIDEKRTGEIDLIVRSIYEELERQGTVVADVTTAHKLDNSVKQTIAKLLGANNLQLREHIDEKVIGGVRVNTPTRVLDATVQNRLMKLRERKI